MEGRTRQGSIESAPAEVLINALSRFAAAMRRANIPVSVSETKDAVEALCALDVMDRDAFKAALAATLIKDRAHYAAFETLFEIYFAPRSLRPWYDAVEEEAGPRRGAGDGAEDWEPRSETEGPGPLGGGGFSSVEERELKAMLLAAVLDADMAQLRALAARAVDLFAGMEPGRPAGGTYYLYRTLQRLDLESLTARAVRELLRRARDARGKPPDGGADQAQGLGPLERRFLEEEVQIRIDRLREFIQAEIRRRLVEDRGPEALARSIQRPLPEDVELMHATTQEIAELRKALHPLTRKLAARLSKLRRKRLGSRLDMRKTLRRSLSYGGVPLFPQLKKPHPAKPEIFLLCDVSGSVANFARFTLQMIYAMSSQFSRVRSWVFVDGIDEVTRFFERAADLTEATHRINTEAKIVWVDGHSDYGHVLTQFWEAHALEITPKTTVIVLGDARNNYHASGAWVLAEMRRRARRVLWLNPEPKSYWDTGDSIMSEYAQFCDGVWECRNLRQLQQFVATLV